MPELKGKKVAIVVADGFEQVEMTEPRKALEQAGAKTEIVFPAEGQVKECSLRIAVIGPGRRSHRAGACRKP